MISTVPSRYVGIDPGVSGGLAVLGDDGEVEALEPTRKEGAEVWIWATASHYCKWPETVAVIEQVTGYVPQPKGKDFRHGGQPSSAGFQFGQNYGAWRCALVASGGTYTENWFAVPPAAWQKGLDILGRGKAEVPNESREQFKRRLREIAQCLYPKVRVVSQVADALLLATYCMFKCRELFGATSAALPSPPLRSPPATTGGARTVGAATAAPRPTPPRRPTAIGQNQLGPLSRPANRVS